MQKSERASKKKHIHTRLPVLKAHWVLKVIRVRWCDQMKNQIVRGISTGKFCGTTASPTNLYVPFYSFKRFCCIITQSNSCCIHLAENDNVYISNWTPLLLLLLLSHAYMYIYINRSQLNHFISFLINDSQFAECNRWKRQIKIVENYSRKWKKK